MILIYTDIFEENISDAYHTSNIIESPDNSHTKSINFDPSPLLGNDNNSILEEDKAIRLYYQILNIIIITH